MPKKLFEQMTVRPHDLTSIYCFCLYHIPDRLTVRYFKKEKCLVTPQKSTQSMFFLAM